VVSGALRRRALAVALGLVGDALTGEPSAAHPVAGFGSAMARLERRTWADDRRRGALYAAVGTVGAGAAGVAARHRLGSVASLAVATWVAVAGRSLVSTAAEVGAALERGELSEARRTLPALVGREPDGLDAQEIARAVVESVAENLSDAVVASVLWGLVAGAPGVLAHRAANTLDAMVGHRCPRYEQFGWASARTDDVLGWPAARLTAVLVAVACPRRAATVWRAVRRDAPHHPSPNAGVAEAAFAAALGLRLGGENRYGGRVEVRPPLGDGRPPGPGDVQAALALANRVRGLLLVGTAALALAPRGRAGRGGMA
jgi:adenosylcobinamide-phosphate synthase